MASDQPTEEYDVIIIGGGVSGLYTAWRLANSTSLKILVLEATDRFGGRFMTCQMPGGFNADLGAMRYSPECHPLLQELIDRLGVITQAINQIDGPENKNKFSFFLRNKRITTLEEVRELFSLAGKDLSLVQAVYQYYFCTHPEKFDLERPEDGNIAHSVFTPTGQMAKDMSVCQYVTQTNNAETFNLSWMFYPPANWQLAVAVGDIGLVTKHWKTVKIVNGGYEHIITAITSALASTNNVVIKRNQKVKSISETEFGFSVKSAVNGETVEHHCQKVIYACSKIGLTTIALEDHRRHARILNLANKVYQQQSLKMYLTYNRAWWEDSGIYQGTVISDLPIHCTIIFGEKGKSGSFATLLAAFPNHTLELFQGLDLNIHDRFENIAGHANEEMTPSKLLVENVDKQLKHVMGCPDLTEKPVCAARYFWGTGETAAMSYQPHIGVDGNRLHWDSLKPFEDADIFIVSDAFPPWTSEGLHLGFSEGPLLTSERILVNHFGLDPFMDGLSLKDAWPAT